MISEQCYKALCFIRDNPKCYAGQVGEVLWGDKPWARRPAGDNGGGSLVACVAGGYMGRLNKRNLVYGYSGSYLLTGEGSKAIDEFEEKHGVAKTKTRKAR